ncbi:MAG: SprT family zinc-dependent metalloprotease [Candidatus Kapabacteria bacterium]|nr:SprT family zinc-dependent metalloprotease [Candidatus Kapabacteria bacterium]
MIVDYLEIDGLLRQYQIELKKTKTIKYKVYPDLTIKVIVPETLSLNEIQIKIGKRKNWIRKSLKFYSNHQNKTISDYKSGSTIKYLGRQYRLKIIESIDENIKLTGKFLVLNVKSKDLRNLENMIEKWYKSHAIEYFNKIILKCLSKLNKYDISQPNLHIRKMKSRWGSCIQTKNKVILNSNLIIESSHCIEYVIMHELCHLKYPFHDNQFYTFLTIVMPDWKIRKNKLENLTL